MTNVIVVVLLELGVVAKIDGDMAFNGIIGALLWMGNVYVIVS